ncbi:hypothetical protein MNB_SV-9-853 [hydrothermal vent metagenome]|uniref:Lipoprotein n=1 Tax=hydrothermal vent metagenome TaxID=652676 RepID=A0A1W1BI66_9ZZZZ
MLIKKSVLSIITLYFMAMGCADKEKVYPPTTTEKGPTIFDNSGTLRCSEGNDNLDDVCDYRSVQRRDYTIMWIEDVESPDLIRYRVFKFSYKTNKFLARNGEPVESEKIGDKYYVSVANSYYQISKRSLTEGYSYKRESVF